MGINYVVCHSVCIMFAGACVIITTAYYFYYYYDIYIYINIYSDTYIYSDICVIYVLFLQFVYVPDVRKHLTWCLVRWVQYLPGSSSEGTVSSRNRQHAEDK